MKETEAGNAELPLGVKMGRTVPVLRARYRPFADGRDVRFRASHRAGSLWMVRMERSVLDGPCRYLKQTAAHGAPGAHPSRLIALVAMKV